MRGTYEVLTRRVQAKKPRRLRIVLNSILATLHPTLDVISKNQQHVDAALSWIGPGSLGLAKATTHGPWADIYVRAIGPDVPGVLCGVIKPQGVQCPT